MPFSSASILTSGKLPKNKKKAGITTTVTLKPEKIKAITPPDKKDKKPALYDLKYSGSKTVTDERVKQNKSAIETYAPIVKIIAVMAAVIAETARSLLFIVLAVTTNV